MRAARRRWTQGPIHCEHLSQERRCLPPLDLDYFKLLAVSPAGRSVQARAPLKYVRDNYSPTLDVAMEFVFVELQGAAEFYRDFNIDRGRISGRPQRTIEHFYKVLPQMLSYCITEECEFHNRLAAALQPKDAVISLNYDCLMDTALKDHGGRRWDPTVGYGLGIKRGASAWRTWGPGRTATTPIRLLKLHGSLNWRDRKGKVSLRTPLLMNEQPPRVLLFHRSVGSRSRIPRFRRVWAEARVRLRSARRLIIIGYSLPPADYLVRALFRADLNPTRLVELLVVDPSPAVADRFVQLLRGPPSKIMTFSSFEEFARYLPPV